MIGGGGGSRIKSSRRRGILKIYQGVNVVEYI